MLKPIGIVRDRMKCSTQRGSLVRLSSTAPSIQRLLLGALFALFAFASVHAQQITTIRGSTMGTSYSVKTSPISTEREATLRERIDARLAEIDALMSTYRSDSEVSRFNQYEEPDWFAVSAETVAVVQRAHALSELTDGAFDVTVGPLVRLWNFGAETRVEFEPPSDAKIRETMRDVGYEKLEFRQHPPALKKQGSLAIDLSAIAKGYGVDQIAELITADGISDFLVEIGGEMRVRGSRPDGERWTVGIEAPTREARRLYGVISPDNAAVASSGDYRNFFEHDGVIYSHTIDPKTGRPVEHNLASATVLAADCATADALATAMLVLGPERAERWAEENGTAALLLLRTDGGVVEKSIGEFALLGPATPASTQQASDKMNFAVFLIPALVIFGLALVGMSIGVIVSNRRIKGSCGGLAGITDEQGRTLCDGCTKPSPDCTGESEA